MTPEELQPYLSLASAIKNLPQAPFRMSYDVNGDVLYIRFWNPTIDADDSELTDDNVIVHFSKGAVIGLTILNVTSR